jgi:type IV pilus assembly protein PilQ
MSPLNHPIRRLVLTGFFALTIGASPLVVGVAQAMDVTGVAIEADPGLTTVQIQVSEGAESAAVSTFTLSGPDRVVVDIADAQIASNLSVDEPDGEVVEKITVETIEDEAGVITRIEVFLAQSVEHTVAMDSGTVRLSLTPTSTPDVSDPLADRLEADVAAPPVGAAIGGTTTDELSGPDKLKTGPTLTTLDFKYTADTNRIIIGTQKATKFSESQPNPKTVFIDIPKAFVPRSLRRVLDSGEFISPVRMVRAYKTGKGARVAITLRRAVDYKAYRSGDQIIVDFAVPQDMRDQYSSVQQDHSTVGPSQGAQPLKNAYQEEIVIGMGGRTVSPQTAWGKGGGAMDPASLLGMASGFMFDSSRATAQPYAGRRISLDFVNADIHSIFRLISHVSKLNIVAGDDVSGQVTVRMEDVPWDQALAAVLQAKGLGSQRFGNIVRVAPIETIKAEQQAALEAKRAQEELTDLSLLVVPLDYASAPDLETQIGSLLTERGSVEVDKRGNQLIVKETEMRLAQVRELVRHLDKQTPQVLIEARVVEANSSYTRSLGIQWGGELDASTSTGYSTGLFFPNNIGASGGISQSGDGGAVFYSANQPNLLVDLPSDGSTGALAFHLGSIPGLVDLDARLAAMESDGWGKVISSPRVTTVDNNAASILQGQKIPYMSTSAGGTQVKYINAALDLSVTPHITSDNRVKLSITVKNDRADFSVLVQGQPAISIKQVQTELMVQDGDTTVIGGVFATEESGSKRMVPGFSKIPLLGFLFKSSVYNSNRNELLVFVTPRVVTRGIVASE